MNFVMRCLVPPGDVNQLTINAGYRETHKHPIRGNQSLFNCSACAQPHSPHHKIHFKKGGHQPAMKLMPPKVPINMECCSGVVTQAYGQPDNPVPPMGVRNNPAILTAAPFRGVPQPEAYGRRKFNDRLSMNQLPRRALSRYALTFQGNILSVNCQCRMFTHVRRTHSTSPVENSLITNPQEGEC